MTIQEITMQYWINAVEHNGVVRQYGPYDDEAEAVEDARIKPNDPTFSHTYVTGESA